MVENVDFAQLLAPYTSMLMGLILSLMIKDFVTSFVKGLAFRLNPLFSEGDAVIVDNEPAIVIKIGLRNTIFSIEKKNGSYTWLSVANERISYLKIEKVIRARAVAVDTLRPDDVVQVDQDRQE